MSSYLNAKGRRSTLERTLLGSKRTDGSSDKIENGLASKVIIQPCDALKPNPRNARRHPQKQIHQLASAIKRFGFVVPILVDERNNILAGHGRLAAARRLELREVPTLQLAGLTDAEKRAYILADNRLGEQANWDYETLRLELQELIELDFEIELTGFSTGEIDVMLDERQQQSELCQNDSLPPLPSAAEVVTLPGDLWQLGPHRILCADALDRDSYLTLLGKDKADLVFIDPPYNVPIDGHVGGLGRMHHREFAMASGEMSQVEFVEFLATAFTRLAAFSRRASIHFVCMDWRHLFEVLTASRSIYSELRNLCVWNKSNAGMGSLYRSQHELIFVFQNGAGRTINNVQLGATGRYRTNVWSYPGMNTFSKLREEELAGHPTVKPVALVADAIRDCSRRNDLVLDAFGGSGTCLIAAHRTGRVGRLIEIDPAYVDLTIRRFQKICSDPITLISTGQPFSEVASSRGAAPGKRA